MFGICITTAVSAVFGALNGFLPDLFKEWKAGREDQRERDRALWQADIQERLAKIGADERLQAAEMDVEKAGAEAFAETVKAASAEQTASLERLNARGWYVADALNALVRPIAGLVAVGVLSFTTIYSVFTGADPHLPAIFGVFSEAVLGYFFGYRAFAKKASV